MRTYVDAVKIALRINHLDSVKMPKGLKGFQLGNQVGARGNKLFDGAIRRAIYQDNGERLRKAAETLLTKAAKGEPWAIGMLADRLDGRVLPMLPDQGDGQLVISWISQAIPTHVSQPLVVEHDASQQSASVNPTDTVARVPSSRDGE